MKTFLFLEKAYIMKNISDYIHKVEELNRCYRFIAILVLLK